MKRIFLCHSHADKPFVRKLAAELRAAGYAVWIDEAEINIGDSLISKLQEGLDQVDYVAAVLSKNSIKSVWVNKELEIALHRELEENKVIVLPLLIEKVEMPGFLKGKVYGDFSDPNSYPETFDLLLRSLGETSPIPDVSNNEIVRLQMELENAKATIEQHKNEIAFERRLALKGKSKKLVDAVENANTKFPLHAPINITYAFELDGIVITLDYLLWIVDKIRRRGSHPVEYLLLSENKWDQAKAMLDAYEELLTAIEER